MTVRLVCLVSDVVPPVPDLDEGRDVDVSDLSLSIIEYCHTSQGMCSRNMSTVGTVLTVELRGVGPPLVDPHRQGVSTPFGIHQEKEGKGSAKSP